MPAGSRCCEAVYLHKPVLASPVREQFEQMLNARYVEAEGYGVAAEHLDAAELATFLERVPEFEAKLAGWHQDGNQHLLAALDELLARASKGDEPLDEHLARASKGGEPLVDTSHGGKA